MVNLGAILVFDPPCSSRRPVSNAVPDIVADVVIGAGYIAVTIAVLSARDINATSVLGASAVVSAILALSLQSTLGNVIGGVALQLDGSFHEGDWLQLENGRQGLVKRIRWRHTVLETRDWGTLIVPNSALLQSQILVLGKRAGKPRGIHRYWVYFNVDFRFPPSRVIEVIDEALQIAPIPNVAQDPRPHCICYDFSSPGRESFGYYAVRYWLTDLSQDDPTNSAVRTRIYAALKRANIPLAMPVHTTFYAAGGEDEAARKVARHRQRRLDALRSVSLFKPLTAEELESLVEHLRYSPTFTKGRDGHEARQRRALALRAHHRQGSRCASTARTRSAKDVACIRSARLLRGDGAHDRGEPRQADVVALTDIECYRLDKEAFSHIMQARPEVAAEFSRTLAERRIELWSVRDDLTEEEKNQRKASEQERILQRIKEFFALDDHATSRV